MRCMDVMSCTPGSPLWHRLLILCSCLGPHACINCSQLQGTLCLMVTSFVTRDTISSLLRKHGSANVVTSESFHGVVITAVLFG